MKVKNLMNLIEMSAVDEVSYTYTPIKKNNVRAMLVNLANASTKAKLAFCGDP